MELSGVGLPAQLWPRLAQWRPSANSVVIRFSGGKVSPSRLSDLDWNQANDLAEWCDRLWYSTVACNDMTLLMKLLWSGSPDIPKRR
jgi:hypothetical protein